MTKKSCCPPSPKAQQLLKELHTLFETLDRTLDPDQRAEYWRIVGERNYELKRLMKEETGSDGLSFELESPASQASRTS